VNKPFAQKMHEQDVDFFKNWVCDTTPINVREGLDNILPNHAPFFSLKKLQIGRIGSKLTGNTISPKGSISVNDGVLLLDDIVTIRANFNHPGMLGSSIRSRLQFVKLIYQYMSCFPLALFDAYKEITGENLILDDLSEVREFYESCSKFDLWTGHEFCAYISHCDPKVLDFVSQYPKIMDYMSKQPENLEYMAKHPRSLELMSNKPEALEYVLNNPKKQLLMRFSRIFSRTDLYERNSTLVKAAILGGAFELIHIDRDNWAQSTLKPQKGLEWAKKKGIDYHPVLDEYLLPLETTPAIPSEYTTPYLGMMQEVIREMEISKDNQDKKEAIAAAFAKKLAHHKLTRPSQKLADAMATLVRLPESQQGRAKRRG